MATNKYRSKLLKVPADSDQISNTINQTILSFPGLANNCEITDTVNNIIYDNDNMSQNGQLSICSQKPTKKKCFTRRSWNRSEDNALKKLVKKMGTTNWIRISRKLPLRKGKQCRDRWLNYLNPTIKKCPWNETEEWQLYLCHK